VPATFDRVRAWPAAAIAAVLLTSCTATVGGTPERTMGSARHGDELTAMLLPLDEIRALVSAPELEIRETYDDFLDYAEFSPEHCAGVPFNTIERAFRDSGYETVRGVAMDADTDAFVDEGVIRFASAAYAHRYVAQSKSTWQDCMGVVAHVVPDEMSDSQQWAIKDTVDLPAGGLMVRTRQVDAAGRECAHAMADRAELVIDVVVCGRRVIDEATTILHRIGRRPPV
jgi:hypothetical protein